MTKIQWTQETWNPLAGCSKVSAGCKNCYAIKDAVRLAGNDNPKIAKKYEGTTDKGNWTGRINLASDEVLMQPIRATRPRMYFVNSMSDLFHENVPDEWIDKIFAVMALSPQHTFQILTKRAERMRDYCQKRMSEWTDFGVSETVKWGDIDYDLFHNSDGLLQHLKDAGWWWDWTPDEYGGDGDLYYDGKTPLPNVWLGVSCENQQTADERIPFLLETPAAIRFLSCEPLLEEIDLTKFFMYCTKHKSPENPMDCFSVEHYGTEWRKIDWIIAGGESGAKARPCNIDWIRSIVSQCQNANVPVFVKQLGGNLSDQDLSECARASGVSMHHKKGGNPSEWAEDLRVRHMPVS
jgi:protein gp37